MNQTNHDPETDFAVNSSPMVNFCPSPSLAFMLATPSPLKFNIGDFSQDINFDIPFPDLSDDQAESKRQSAINSFREPSPFKPQFFELSQHEAPTIYKPFSSIGEIELTVQTLRNKYNTSIRHKLANITFPAWEPAQ